MIREKTNLVCHWWRAKKYVKSVSWFKGPNNRRLWDDPNKQSLWWTKMHFTTDKREAVAYTRYEWMKIFMHSGHGRFQTKSYRLELPTRETACQENPTSQPSRM